MYDALCHSCLQYVYYSVGRYMDDARCHIELNIENEIKLCLND